MKTSIENASGRKVYENPIIRDKVVFLETSAESGGRHTLLELELAPNGGNTLHVHEDFSETFIALEGDLQVYANGEFQILQPGASFTVQPNVPHYFRNPCADAVKFRIKIEPGQEGFEQGLKIAYGLAKDGLTDKRGMPKKFAHIALVVALSGTKPAGIFSLLMPLFKWKANQARKQGILDALIEKYN